jgi:magnesium-transporting ATPase (P-type)
MVGDGVNDITLKAANIGVMGKRELKLQRSRRSYFKMMTYQNDYRCSAGRRIYSILKKQYVISFPFIFPSY